MLTLSVYLNGVFDDAFCDDVMKLASNLPDQVGKVGELGTNNENKNIRRSKIKWINPSENSGFIYGSVERLFRDVNRDVFGLDIDYVPSIQFTEYDASDEGTYDWHIDTNWTQDMMYHRKISMSVQLSPSTAYEGGDLQLEDGATLPADLIRPRGTVIMFPSFVRHRVTPVTQGTRYSLVAWIEGPKFR